MKKKVSSVSIKTEQQIKTDHMIKWLTFVDSFDLTLAYVRDDNAGKMYLKTQKLLEDFKTALDNDNLKIVEVAHEASKTLTLGKKNA